MSCDLTPCDFFFWSNVKAMAYSVSIRDIKNMEFVKLLRAYSSYFDSGNGPLSLALAVIWLKIFCISQSKPSYLQWNKHPIIYLNLNIIMKPLNGKLYKSKKSTDNTELEESS